MTSPTTLISKTVRDPSWLAHRYEPDNDAIHFISAPREVRRSVPFLTDEYLKTSGTARPIARADALAIAANANPVHFIYHSAYCCSTLLARAFDLPGISSSLKEPQILNDVVGWRQRGGDPKRIGPVLDSSLQMLARPFEPGEASIVKPSNILNGLAEPMLTMRPEAGCVILYAPLRIFLASIARKGMFGRLWVRELLSRQLVDGLVNLGFEPRDYLLHTDLQAGAVGWLAQHQLFAHLARRWPDRVRTLDSEVLVARPAEALAASAGLFGLTLGDDAIASIVADDFARDAKTDTVFTQGQREAERLTGEALHADEINKVAIWAEAVARTAGVDLTLPAPLLGR